MLFLVSLMANSAHAGKVDVCHNGNIININENAVSTHLNNHGDWLVTEEVCDGVDNDCDGSTDEAAVDAGTWYVDADDDGYGDIDSTTIACDAPTGYVADATDCDDDDDAVNPGADEVCDDIDNDCDGDIDGGAVDADVWYADTDGDTYGDANNAALACEQPSGHVSDDTDCDDDEDDAFPGNTEVCDDIDNDCDGDIDGGAIDADVWYADNDGDGYGDAGDTTEDCDQPSGYVSDDTDCDDDDNSINPGVDEVCEDGIDNDCDGEPDAVCCPCVEEWDFPDPIAAGGCSYSDDDGFGGQFVIETLVLAVFGQNDSAEHLISATDYGPLAESFGTPDYECSYFGGFDDPNGTIALTAEEYDGCFSEIEAFADESGLTCMP